MWSNFLNNSNIVYIKESLEYFDKGYHTIENVLNWVYSFYQVLIQFLKKKEWESSVLKIYKNGKRNKDCKFQCFVTKQKLINIYQPLFLYYLLHLFYTP